MSISVKCGCGKSLRAKLELAGKKVRCPSCSNVMKLPLPQSDSEEDAANFFLADPEPSEKKSAINYSTSIRDEELVPPPPRAITAKTPALPPPKPEIKKKSKPKKKSRSGYSGVAFEEGWFGDINSGAIGGLLMMIIAAVWFVLGWLGGIIFIYPPILFVLGFIAFIKGLLGRE